MPYKRTTQFTMHDLKALCFSAREDDYTRDPVISDLRPRFTKKLREKLFSLEFTDGGKLFYRFDRFGLSWSEDGESWEEEKAECLESTRGGVYLVRHLRTHVTPFEAVTLVLDENTGSAVLVHDAFGKASGTRDVRRTVRIGWFGEKPDLLPAFSDELVGKVIDWKFADEIRIHTVYCNVQCLAFVSPVPEKAPGWADYFETFNPTRYVKVAHGLYLVSFYAPYACGMEVSMLIDLSAMRALGAAFGLDSTDRFCAYTFGAKGAYAPLGFVGSYTVD